MKKIAPVILALALCSANLKLHAAVETATTEEYESVCILISPSFAEHLDKLEAAANDGSEAPTYDKAMELSLAFAASDVFTQATNLERAAYYRNLSWLQLKLKQYHPALASAKEAISLYPLSMHSTALADISRLVLLSIAIRVPNEIHAWLQAEQLSRFRAPIRLLDVADVYAHRDQPDLAWQVLHDGTGLLIGKSVYDRDIYFGKVYAYLVSHQFDQYVDALSKRYQVLGGTHDLKAVSQWAVKQNPKPKMTPAKYPAKAMKAAVTGCVYLDLDVSVDGKTRVVNAVEVPEGYGFAKAATVAGKKIKWDKLTDIDGNPAESHAQHTRMTFMMNR